MPDWISIMGFRFICTQWNGLGFGNTLNNWEFVKLSHEWVEID